MQDKDMNDYPNPDKLIAQEGDFVIEHSDWALAITDGNSTKLVQTLEDLFAYVGSKNEDSVIDFLESEAAFGMPQSLTDEILAWRDAKLAGREVKPVGGVMNFDGSDAQWDKLLGHIGFGNPQGKFWFIGIEERGKGTPEELAWRQLFQPIEDLISVHDRWKAFEPEYVFKARTLIPTWGTMSKIVLRLKGASNWADREAAREYQSSLLGRPNGETLLTEILPLPALSVSDWPMAYQQKWATKESYRQEVLPERIKTLRDLFEANHPRYVFCYGKGHWEHYKKVFPEVEPALDGFVELATIGSSKVILTPFFGFFIMTPSLIDKIASLVEK